ncbi:MAG: peptidylprolyl isomerase, partial [Candidatus Gastranaerophilales bacterium]|nr:peptidylprolyl isomerase [Candidatus Gastranaerophilales bacterium]
LLNQEMSKRNIAVSKEDTEKERQKMIDRIGSKEKFNEILKQNGITNSQFEDDLAQEIKMKKLVDIIHPVKISDAQAKAFYDKNAARFRYPDKVRASHILIAANPVEIKEKLSTKDNTLTEEQKNEKVKAEMIVKYQKAQALANQLKTTPDKFEAVAREKSDDPITAKNGGDIGFFAQKDMVKPFADAAFKQKPNTVSDVVQTPYGFHIIKVTDRMAAGQEPFIKIKEQLKLYLAAQEQVKALEQYINNLRADAVIQYMSDSYDPVKIEVKMKKIAAEKKAAAQNVKEMPAEPVKK